MVLAENGTLTMFPLTRCKVRTDSAVFVGQFGDVRDAFGRVRRLYSGPKRHQLFDDNIVFITQKYAKAVSRWGRSSKSVGVEQI